MLTTHHYLRHAYSLLKHAYSTQSHPESVRKAFKYCVGTVKTNDYESFLWVSALSKSLQPSIFALRALDVGTSQIAEHAKGEMLLMMRFQWWRDAINSTFKGKPPQQPVMIALGYVLEHCHLTRYRLQKLLSTKEEGLTSQQAVKSLAALEDQAEGTVSRLLYLQLEAAGLLEGQEDPCLQAMTSHIGRAVGLVNVLKSTHMWAQRHRSYLPLDLCQRHNIDYLDLLKGNPTMGLRDTVCDIAMAAKDHLQVAREDIHKVPREARALLLSSVGAELYLNALEKVGFNVYDEGLIGGGYSMVKYQLHLKWKQLKGAL